MQKILIGLIMLSAEINHSGFGLVLDSGARLYRTQANIDAKHEIFKHQVELEENSSRKSCWLESSSGEPLTRK